MWTPKTNIIYYFNGSRPLKINVAFVAGSTYTNKNEKEKINDATFYIATTIEDTKFSHRLFAPSTDLL